MVTNIMQLRTDGTHKVPFAKCIDHVTYHRCIRTVSVVKLIG